MDSLPKDLHQKYFKGRPRYSVYPIQKNWNNQLDEVSFYKEFENTDKKISLYVHIPFCEKLCTFCGCNIKVSENRNLVDDYINCLINDLNLKLQHNQSVTISEIYFGGGTPTFLNSKEFHKLLNLIFNHPKIQIDPDFIGTIEIDPRHFNHEQMNILDEFHFKKFIIGVQDFDEQILKRVNRTQSLSQIENTLSLIDNIENRQIWIELISGLPGQSSYQNQNELENYFNEILKYRPTSFIIYPCTDVPWLEKLRPAFLSTEHLEQNHLHNFERIFHQSQYLKKMGFEIYSLFNLVDTRDLHRENIAHNIMGLNFENIENVLGIGVSAISSNQLGFLQNEKIYDHFLQNRLEQKTQQTRHQFNQVELETFKVINQLKTHKKTNFSHLFDHIGTKQKDLLNYLMNEMALDDLIQYDQKEILITEQGEYFLHSIISQFPTE